MLWVLKKIVSMRRLLWARKTADKLKLMDKKIFSILSFKILFMIITGIDIISTIGLDKQNFWA